MRSTDRTRRIEQRAYEIWEREGRPHGKHDEHWHRAAEEITRESGGRGGAARGGSAAASKPRTKTNASAKKAGGATSRTAKPAASARTGTGSTTRRRSAKPAGTPSSS
jgi:hypothetical protein